MHTDTLCACPCMRIHNIHLRAMRLCIHNNQIQQRPISQYTTYIFACSIAFKPAESGWGSGGSYTKNYDSIFSSTTKKKMNRHEEKCPTLNSDGDAHATTKNTEKGS